MNSFTPVNFKLWKEYLVLKFSNHPLLAANTSSFAYFMFKYSLNARAWLSIAAVDIGIFVCIKSCIQTRSISSIFSKFSFLTILTYFACDPNPEEELRILSLLCVSSTRSHRSAWQSQQSLRPHQANLKFSVCYPGSSDFLNEKNLFFAGAMLRFMYLNSKIASNSLWNFETEIKYADTRKIKRIPI